MLQLKKEHLKYEEKWKKVDVDLPRFDIDHMIETTKNNPVWIHFGAGNIFRGYIARLQNTLLNSGKAQSGIIACEAFDYSIIEHIYQQHDNLTLSVTLTPDGAMEKKLVASVAVALETSPTNTASLEKLKFYFLKPSLQMVTFTITEAGYRIRDNLGELNPAIRHDMDHPPEKAIHTMGMTTAMLYERYKMGSLPIAMVSLDNCTQNGEKLKYAIISIAKTWSQKGFVDGQFIHYLNNEKHVSFPWSMIDKITPMPSEKVAELLERDGIKDTRIIETDKQTVIAPFVNSEAPEYLIVEDNFPNGRPELEDAGICFTDRETVNKCERMKVTACLNPLMTALGIFGCLLGYKTIADEMADPDLFELVNRLSKRESLPIVENPVIICPESFLEEVLTERLPNKYILDTPQRTAIDMSQKMPNRFGEIIKKYTERQDLDLDDLLCVPLIIAGWCRYLMGVNDFGEPFELSRDPMINELTGYLDGIELGKPKEYRDQLRPILSNPNIFTMNLYDTCLGTKITAYFLAMIKGNGAIRMLIHKSLANK